MVSTTTTRLQLKGTHARGTLSTSTHTNKKHNTCAHYTAHPCGAPRGVGIDTEHSLQSFGPNLVFMANESTRCGAGATLHSHHGRGCKAGQAHLSASHFIWPMPMVRSPLASVPCDHLLLKGTPGNVHGHNTRKLGPIANKASIDRPPGPSRITQHMKL